MSEKSFTAEVLNNVIITKKHKYLNASYYPVKVNEKIEISESKIHLWITYMDNTDTILMIGLSYHGKYIDYNIFDDSTILILNDLKVYHIFTTFNNFVKTYNYLSAGQINQMKLSADIKNIIKKYCLNKHIWKGPILFTQEYGISEYIDIRFDNIQPYRIEMG